MNVRITDHAKQRAHQKFGVKVGGADNWIRQYMKDAVYIGEITDEDGNVTRLFGNNRVALVLDRYKDVVITVYPRQTKSTKLRNIVLTAITTELTKLDRSMLRKKRSVERMKSDIYAEISERMAERLRTKSEARRMALTARINALQAHFAILDEDVSEVKRDHSAFRKGVVAYV
jgi:hypothetical protein